MDALAWVSSREVVFTSLAGDRFRVRKPGLNLLGLLPIAIDFRVAHYRPLFTRTGVLVPPAGQVTAGALSDPAEYSEVTYEEARLQGSPEVAQEVEAPADDSGEDE